MKRSLLALAVVASSTLVACGGGGGGSTNTAQFPQNTDMWQGLGGDTKAPAAVSKVVNDAVTGLLADPKTAPYFANIGKPGHDSADRLTACLNLQFNALFGGPYSYPGQVVADGRLQTCDDMATAHADVGIPGCVFDQFIGDLAGALTANGVPQAYINRAAPVLVGLKGQVVSATPMYLGPNTAQNCQ
ncbi:MAG: group 1 truncated hemoglobin [Burkholderiales bacterium]|nr:group 1 truncated hemoglobin [Burkholderiales bacterium]